MDELYLDACKARLADLGETLAAEYQAADPFPHIAIDNFLPEEPLRRALAAFPTAKELRWIDYDRATERKLAFPEAERLPAPLRDVLHFLNSAPVLRFLEKLTGIGGLVADPYFLGGGLHQIEPGGFLEVHADFNRYKKLNLDRRLNLLVYLNQDWQDEYGGHLELWDRSMTRCVKKILPVFNRCVVFTTTSDSYHGHPTPLTCPPDRSRKSMATYYYTAGRPAEQVTPDHDTLFRHRPGAPAALMGGRVRRGVKRVVRALTPPILADAVYTLRHRAAKAPSA
jgi:2OG-Fe(II) oxygenase superfamily